MASKGNKYNLSKEQKKKLEAKMTNSLANKKRGPCEPIRTGDMTAVLTLITDSISYCGGRPCVYPPSSEGLESFIERSNEFFKYVNELNEKPEIEKKLIPDVETWSVFLGITRNTIFEYEKRGGEWKKAIDFFKNTMNAAKKQLALSGKIPPVLYIFDSANNHGYSNVSEFKVQATSITVQSEQSQIERDIASSGLVWDDEAKDFVPVNGEVRDADGRTIIESKESPGITEK